MTTDTENKKTTIFNWKLFLIILIMLASGVLAKVPAFILLEELADKPGTWGQVTLFIFIEQFLIFGVIPAGLGILLSSRLGLKIPFLENWILKSNHEVDLRKTIRDSTVFALGLAVIGVIIQFLIESEIIAMGLDVGKNLSPNALTTWWSMLLLSFSAGVVEEIIFRLGLLTIFAAAVNLLWKPRKGALKPGAFWLANIITALLFSLTHFLNYSALELPLTFGLIWKTIAGNSFAALTFGWLYWKHGLESAMFSHFLLDICIYIGAPTLFLLIRA